MNYVECADQLDAAVAAFEEADARHIEARVEEMKMEDERHTAKHAAVLRVLKEPNEATGKAHSATSAAESVTLDYGYRDYLKRLRDAVMESMRTKTARDVALARMNFAARRGAE